MTKVDNNLKSGFLARVCFYPDKAPDFTLGPTVVEILYPQDDDRYEFIDFYQQFQNCISSATLLLADGSVIDASELSTEAQE